MLEALCALMGVLLRDAGKYAPRTKQATLLARGPKCVEAKVG